MQQELGDRRNALVTAINLAVFHLRHGNKQVAGALLDQANTLACELSDQERMAQIEQLRTHLG